MTIDYNERIPNNVDLASDRRLQRALEGWQPSFLDWWRDRGPKGFHDNEVYLRTAISIEPGGWAHFDHVRMPEYRWGIFLGGVLSNRLAVIQRCIGIRRMRHLHHGVTFGPWGGF